MMTDDQLVRRLIAVRQANRWPTAIGEGEINTDYIEGMDLDGTPNENRKNAFDDLHVVWAYRGSCPIILLKAECTTQPGARYTLRPVSDEGAAIIALGYQECWQPGLHKGKYPAFIQTGGEVQVWRDRSKTYEREQGALKCGWFGINQHHAYDAPRSDIGGHSAGCLVTRLVKDHERACALKKSDPRYIKDNRFVFGVGVMTAAQLLDPKWNIDHRPRPSPQPDVPKDVVTAFSSALAALGAMGTYLADHWPWFAVGAFVLVLFVGLFYWREPYGGRS
jgi:hypothetical protein